MSEHTPGPAIKYANSTTDVVERAEALTRVPIDRRLRVPTDVILRDAIAEIRFLRRTRLELLEAARAAFVDMGYFQHRDPDVWNALHAAIRKSEANDG